ncbi:DUF3231 family protein [Lederbergia wuyishanensis]|uniref:DUF3231 family protein n=1 Tax=Lederbergia wuyishanensis TaxID=1347903 RepID=A0ABU0D6R7_9BACI|nr:DUF3231 family protein [Lederbergia wuyishanensis]MCJ8008760.1 DUF3231 family protein [Lederbergia wuyishanensis]MDQ0344080.1 hypothetical protein [Lederbergia wuyishanensis]
MGILSGNPKDEPMHYGEVFGLWTYLMSTKGLLTCYQIYLNHAGDSDLQSLLNEASQLTTQEVKEIESLLKETGVALPPTPPERSKAALEDIPPGARFLDPEISTLLARDIAAGLLSCSTVIGESIREDIGMMFLKFHTERATLGAKLLRLVKEKGWLIPPPLHISSK